MSPHAPTSQSGIVASFLGRKLEVKKQMSDSTRAQELEKNTGVPSGEEKSTDEKLLLLLMHPMLPHSHSCRGTLLITLLGAQCFYYPQKVTRNS